MKNIKMISIGMGIASAFFISLFIVKRILDNKQNLEKFIRENSLSEEDEEESYAGENYTLNKYRNFEFPEDLLD